MKYHQLTLELPEELRLANLLGCEQDLRANPSESLRSSLSSLEEAIPEIAEAAEKQTEGSGVSKKDLTFFLKTAVEIAPQVCGVPFPQLSESTNTGLLKILRKEGDSKLGLAALIDAVAGTKATAASLALQESLEYLLGYSARVDAADSTQPHIKAVAETTTKAFSIFCRSEGVDVEEDFETQLCDGLKSFLTDLCSFQSLPSKQEIVFLETLVWLRDLASQFELDVAQWTFLFASLEQAFYLHSGPQAARYFTGFCDRFQAAAPGFTFVGEFLRQSEQIAIKLLQEKDLPYVEFEWEQMLVLLLAQETLTLSGDERGPLFRYLLQSESPLSGTSSEDFSSIMHCLVNSSRELVERNWLDKLEDACLKMGDCLQFKEHWQATSGPVEDTVAKAAYDIKQTLEVFGGADRLEADLVALLREAAECSLVEKSIGTARNTFCSHFVLQYVLAEPQLWNQSAPLSRAIVAAFGKDSPNRFLAKDSSGLTIFSSLEQASDRTLELLESLAENAQHISPVEGESHKVVTLLNRATLNRLIASTDSASIRTAHWFLNRVAPTLTNQDSLSQKSLSKAADALANDELTATITYLSNNFHRLNLSHRLWEHSESIAQRAASRVYRDMPEYSNATEGKAGEGKCARDSSFALRKLSLALKPGDREPQDAFASWWRTLVNQYVKNRPPGLFRQTAEALVDCAASHLSESSLELLRQTLVPVYLEADGKNDEEVEKYVFPQLKPGVQLGFSEQRRLQFESLAEEAHQSALDYATSTLGGATWSKESAEELRETLVGNLGAFTKNGGVSKRLASRLSKLNRDDKGQAAGQVERYLVGFFYSLADCDGKTLVPRLGYLAFLQACIENVRLSYLRETLEKHKASLLSALEETSLSKAEAKRLLLALTSPLGLGAAAWSRFESSRRAFDEMAATKSSRDELLAVIAAVDDFSHKHLAGGPKVEMAGLLEVLESLISDVSILDVQRNLSQSEGFLFSPTPQEETEWRSLVFYSLTLLTPGGDNFPTPASVSGAFNICKEPGFLDRFQKVVGFLEKPLSAYARHQMLSLGEALQNWCNWRLLLEEEEDELEDLVKGGNSSLSSSDILSLLQLFALGPQHHQRWSIPTAVVANHELLVRMGTIDPKELKQSIEDVQARLEDPELKALWSGGWNRWESLVDQLEPFLNQWEAQPPKTESESLAKDVCRRDQTYLKRRLALDAWASSSGAFEWYRREVGGYTGTHPRDIYREMVQGIAHDHFKVTDFFSLNVATVDLVRNFHNSLVSRNEQSADWAMARAKPLSSVRNRELALRDVLSAFSCLFREFESDCAKDLYCEQLSGLSSRVGFERLKSLTQSTEESAKQFDDEQSALLKEAPKMAATEFFVRWDLMERRADHIACLEIPRELSADLLESEVGQIWADTLASYPEPSAFGSFLSQLPIHTTHQDLTDFISKLEQFEPQSPRVLSIIRRWVSRLKLVQENLGLLSERALSELSRSLVVGAVCSQDSEQLADAVRWDFVLEQEGEDQIKTASARLMEAWKQIQETFLSEDLSGVREEVKKREQVLSLWSRRREWTELVGQLESKLWESFPGKDNLSAKTHRAFLEALPLILCQPQKSPTFWHMPSILTSLSHDVLAALQASDKEERKRWQIGIVNAASRAELPETVVSQAFEALDMALDNNEQASQVLANLTGDSSDTGATVLLNLKLAADILNGDNDSHQAAVWLVQAFTTDRRAAPKPLVKSVKALLSRIMRSSELEGVRDKCKSLKLRLDEAAKADTVEGMLVELDSIAQKSDSELSSSRGWFAKLSDSFEAVVGG